MRRTVPAAGSGDGGDGGVDRGDEIGVERARAAAAATHSASSVRFFTPEHHGVDARHRRARSGARARPATPPPSAASARNGAARSKSSRSRSSGGRSRSIASVRAPACTARMPSTPQPRADAAATIVARAERLVVHVDRADRVEQVRRALDRGRRRVGGDRVAHDPRGSAMPVIPHAPMRPSATSASNAGRTSSTKRVHGVGELRRRPSAKRGGDVAVGHEVGVQPQEVDPVEAHRGERPRQRRARCASAAGPSGSPSITLVPIRTPAGSRPPNASPITVLGLAPAVHRARRRAA